MLLQTNSYIVPKERRAEHARLMRRFRQVLNRLGCDDFEIYEQVGANWSSGQTSGRFVQIMRFRDRRHQVAVQAAERDDKAAQELIAEFCALINYPYQQQQQQFAVGYYNSVLPVAPGRAPRAEETPAAGDDGAGGESLAAGAAAVAAAEAESAGELAEETAAEPEAADDVAPEGLSEDLVAEEPMAGEVVDETAEAVDAGETMEAPEGIANETLAGDALSEEAVAEEALSEEPLAEEALAEEAAEDALAEEAATDDEPTHDAVAAEPEMHLADELGLGGEAPAEHGVGENGETAHETAFGDAPGHPLDDELTRGDDFKVPEIGSSDEDDISRLAEELSAGDEGEEKHRSGTSGSGMH
jgi:hypothetical protein